MRRRSEIFIWEVGYAVYDSRSWVCSIEGSPDGNPSWQNLLVGGRQAGAIPKTSKIVSALYGLEGGGHSQLSEKRKAKVENIRLSPNSNTFIPIASHG
jgi:hypothetical protein